MSLAEQVIGIKAKKFLMQSVYSFALKYSKIASNWKEIVSELIGLSLTQSFEPDEKKMEESTIKFLQWLGFSPVDVKFYPDQKIGRFMLGTSRMWENPRENQVVNVLLLSLISALGKNFLGEKPEVVVLTEQLPPRINIGYEIRERYGDISTFQPTSVEAPTEKQKEGQPSDISSSQPNYKRYVSLLDPFIGPTIDLDEAAKILTEEALKLLSEQYPEVIASFDVKTLHVLLFLFQQSAKEDKWKETAIELGKRFATRIHEKYPNITPNDAIEGMGALKPETFDEFLFYGKHTSTEEFCHFLVLIFQEYINEFMKSYGLEFKADKPLCATTGSSLCLYAYVKK